jgi:hypothetical protein
MTTLFLYVLASSHDPDNVECPVPYQINDKVIFFGPCKKPLREWLRRRYLKAPEDDVSLPSSEDIFVAGVNGSNPQHNRKIVWAGRVSRAMTFEAAYNDLTTPEFQEMQSCPLSPLHVEPKYDTARRFSGYEHISLLHEDCWVPDTTQRCQATGRCPDPRGDKRCWVTDIIKSNAAPHTRLKGKQLILAPGADRSRVFTRDCCFLCDNIFFARGKGISITEAMLGVLRKAQRDKEIDRYAIFGYQRNKHVEGLIGRYLEIPGQLADELMGLITADIPASQGLPANSLKLKPCDCS